MMTYAIRTTGLLCLLLLAGGTGHAEDVVNVKLMTLEVAVEVARGTIDACREEGYQVAVVVVDRSGRTQVVMRDIYANQFMTEIAASKANAVILSGTSSGELASNRADIAAELNLIDGILLLRGGVPIRVAGSIIGAVGVSGAPGGDKDEACALKGMEKVQERLDFAE